MEARLSHFPFLNKAKSLIFVAVNVYGTTLAVSFMFIVQEMWYFQGFPLATQD